MVECTTTSAPSASGCWRYGVANVLSTTHHARPARGRARATAAMSTMPQRRVGRRLDPHERVSAGQPSARRRRIGEVDRASTRWPARRWTLSIRRNVPPYASSASTTWSPGPSSAQDRVLGGQAAGERRARARAPSSVGQARLERSAGRVAAAAVLVTRVLADRAPGRTSSTGVIGVHHRAGAPGRAPDRRGWPGSRTRAPTVGARRHGRRPPRPARGTPSTSDRVSTPIGRPPSSTSTAGAVSSSSTASSTGSPMPTVGSGGLITSLDRPVEHRRVAEREVHERELARPRPITSAAASGGSPCATGTCDTPCSRIVEHRVADGLVGVDVHERRDVARPAPSSTSATRALRRAEEAEVGHPLVVVDLRQVAAARVGEQHDDERRRARSSRPTSSAAAHRGAARAADQQALLARDPAGRRGTSPRR